MPIGSLDINRLHSALRRNHGKAETGHERGEDQAMENVPAQPARRKSDRLAVFMNISGNQVFVTEIQVKSRSDSYCTVNIIELINITRI
jgi:hypothetical protein